MTIPESTEPLSTEEESELRRQHQPRVLAASTHEPKPVWCAHCGSFDRPWPCSVARLLADRERASRVTQHTVAALTEALHVIAAEFCDPFDDDHPVGMHNSQAAAILAALPVQEATPTATEVDRG